MKTPHPDLSPRKINCAVITVSDTRTSENNPSGQLIRQLLLDANHHILHDEIIADEPHLIKNLLEKLGNHGSLETIVFTGGTGISPRDNTSETLTLLFEKTLFGFGEIFRLLSYQEIGSRAIASRAVAGVYRGKIIFSLPGSQGAVSLAMSKLILPEIIHLVTQINPPQ